MNIAFRLTTLSLVMMLYLGCNANQPCTVPLEQSPELRGFRLGMSLSGIQNRFSGFPSVSANRFGVATVEISSDYRKNVLNEAIGDDVVSSLSASSFPELNELKHVHLKLLDGRLIEITVFYPNDIKWQSADEFVQKTGEVLKLDGQWQPLGKDNEYSESRFLQCGDILKGFNVTAGFRKPPSESPSLFAPKLPYVQLEDFMHGEMEIFSRKKESEERAKREEERRKQTFRP
jgi:hypothetical protein